MNRDDIAAAEAAWERLWQLLWSCCDRPKPIGLTLPEGIVIVLCERCGAIH